MSHIRLIVLALFVVLVAACEPQLRIRNLSPVSLRDQGYSRYEIVVGQARSYTNVLDLVNGRATLYQTLESEGSQWVNRYTITATTNGSNTFTLTGTLVPESLRSMFQQGNRYVWDLTPTNDPPVTLD